MDWELIGREWQTFLGACSITWIATVYVLDKLHKRALKDQQNFDRDRLIRKHMVLLSETQRRLANELFERAPDRYIDTLKSMSADVKRLLGEGEQTIGRRIETLEDEARSNDLLDSPSVREITSLKEEFGYLLDDELVAQYQLISTLYFIHRRSPVPESNLSWALEKKRERQDANLRWRLKKADAEYSAFEATIRRIAREDPDLGKKIGDHIHKTFPVLYEGSDFKALFVDYLPASRQGFAFEHPAQHGVVEVFVDDDKIFTSIYRSNSSFEDTERLEDRHDTPITYPDRTNEKDTL